jgi:hypothetical protein
MEKKSKNISNFGGKHYKTIDLDIQISVENEVGNLILLEIIKFVIL